MTVSQRFFSHPSTSVVHWRARTPSNAPATRPMLRRKLQQISCSTAYSSSLVGGFRPLFGIVLTILGGTSPPDVVSDAHLARSPYFYLWKSGVGCNNCPSQNWSKETPKLFVNLSLRAPSWPKVRKKKPSFSSAKSAATTTIRSSVSLVEKNFV